MQATYAAPPRDSVLLSFGAICTVIFQVAILYAPIHQVASFRSCVRAKGQDYMIHHYIRTNDDSMVVARNPMPTGYGEKWSQYANTKKCNHFCAIMADKVQRGSLGKSPLCG